MSITEPATVITNGLLAALGVWMGLYLLRFRGSSRAKLLWANGFLALAAGAILGAVFHGSANYLDASARNAIWNVTVVLIGATIGFMVSAGLSSELSRRSRHTHWLIAGGAVTGLGFLVQQSGLSLTPGFNHNDLYHCIQAVGLYCYFRCASLGP
jgi:hypothetical protein